MTFARLGLYYRTQDLYLFARGALSEGLRFRIALTTRHRSVVVCLREYCRIGAISASRHIQYIVGIWSLTRVCAIRGLGIRKKARSEPHCGRA